MITSTSNSQIKNLVLLGTKSKERKAQGLFLVEGIKMFLEAPKERIVQIYVSNTFYKHTEYQKEIEEKGNVQVVDDSIFHKISNTITPQGILCVMRQWKDGMETWDRVTDGIFLVLEGVQDPGNLGTIFRTGEGAGVKGIIMDHHTADVYNPKVIRSTMGSIFRIPFAKTDCLERTIKDLKKGEGAVYASCIKGGKNYTKVTYKKKSIFLIGNEGRGLTKEIIALANERVFIPMCGQVESLNAAVSASLLIYEAYRQKDLHQ